MVYTTRAKIESYLKTTFDTKSSPDRDTVDGWITDVDTEIDNLTGTTFQSTTNTEYFDVRQSTNKFLVSNYPLITVTSIEYNSGSEFSPTWTAFDNYRTVGDVIITDKEVQGNYKVKVVYNYGHASVPPEVEYLATLMIAKKIVSSDDATNGAYTSTSVGGLSITNNIGLDRFANLDNNIKETLKRVGKFGTVFK